MISKHLVKKTATSGFTIKLTKTRLGKRTMTKNPFNLMCENWKTNYHLLLFKFQYKKYLKGYLDYSCFDPWVVFQSCFYFNQACLITFFESAPKCPRDSELSLAQVKKIKQFLGRRLDTPQSHIWSFKQFCLFRITFVRINNFILNLIFYFLWNSIFFFTFIYINYKLLIYLILFLSQY